MRMLMDYRTSCLQIPKVSIMEPLMEPFRGCLLQLNRKKREDELAEQIGDVVEKIKQWESDQGNASNTERLYNDLEKLLNEYMELRSNAKQETRWK